MQPDEPRPPPGNPGAAVRHAPAASRGWAPAAWPVAALTVAAALAMAAGVARRYGDAIEAVTPVTLGVAVTAAAVAVAGGSLLAVSRHRDLALLSTTACVLMVAVVVLSIFGILVLPLVVATVVMLARRATGRRGILVALAAGPPVAAGTAVLLAIWVQPPLVECRDDGVQVSSRPWWDGASGSGTSQGGPAGSGAAGSTRSTGEVETPSGRYTYRCDGSTLAEFRRA